jgi:hypothetical protein
MLGAVTLSLAGAAALGAVGAANALDLPIFRTARVADCQPALCGVDYTVSATATNADSSYLGLNVVLAAGTGHGRAAAIAGALAKDVGGRVIVRFFDEVAGAEQFAFGPIPADAEPALPPAWASYLGSVELRNGEAVTETWVR